MTLKEKIGQMFMVGFDGSVPPRTVLRLIKEFHLGGVILFSRNLTSPAQTAKLTSALQTASRKMPLLISIDQEGGRVSRLPKGFTIFPGGAALASCQSPALVYRAAEATAKEVRAVGINMNLAPVLDVDTNPKNPIIGDRAFGSSPTLVSTLGLTMIAGFQDNRVIACGKHFPGHGDTAADSHKALPRVEQNRRRLQEVELRPFAHTIQNGLAAIMTAHVVYPELDPDEPATLSRKIMTTLLRQGMGFVGVLITDDLEMAAISDLHGPGEAAVKAIEAGADVVLFCRDKDKPFEAIEAVANAVKKKRISEARLDQSLLRILKIKEKFILPHHPPDPAQIKAVVGCSAHKHLLQEIQEKAEATAVKTA